MSEKVADSSVLHVGRTQTIGASTDVSRAHIDTDRSLCLSHDLQRPRQFSVSYRAPQNSPGSSHRSPVDASVTALDPPPSTSLGCGLGTARRSSAVPGVCQARPARRPTSRRRPRRRASGGCVAIARHGAADDTRYSAIDEASTDDTRYGAIDEASTPRRPKAN